MRVLDRIRQFILEETESGRLKPGDRLPSLAEFKNVYGSSYMTVKTAMDKLSREGLVEIRPGSGTYLAGGTPLKLLFLIIPSSISCHKMSQLLKKHLACSNLNLEFEVVAFSRKFDEQKMQELGREFDAVFYTYPSLTSNITPFPRTYLRNIPQYAELLEHISLPPHPNDDYAMPFTYAPSCIGINTKLARKTGFSADEINGSFDWWDGFVARCKAQGVSPVANNFTPYDPTLLSAYTHALLMMSPFDRKRYYGKTRLFDTPEGRKLFRIISDTQVLTGENQSFFSGESVLAFDVGSWVAEQSMDPSRPDINLEDIELVPLVDRNGNEFMPYTAEAIEVHLSSSLERPEVERIMGLLKLLVSRDFQLDYCNVTGMLSVNKDIYPHDYYWNRDGKWDCLADVAGRQLIALREVFHPSVRPLLNMLIANYKFFGEKMETVLQRMDVVKEPPFMLLPQSFTATGSCIAPDEVPSGR